MAVCLNNTDEMVLSICKPMPTLVFIAKEKKTISVPKSRKGIVKIPLCSVLLIISFLNSGHFKFQNTCSFKRDYQTLVYVYMNENHQGRVTEKLFVNCPSVHFLLTLINTYMKMILT